MAKQNNAKAQPLPQVQHLPRMSKAVIITQLGLNLAAICGFALWGYTWLNQSVSKIVEAKLEIYVEMEDASLAAHEQRYDEAIAAYYSLYQKLGKSASQDATNRNVLPSVFTGWLFALANCPDPGKHSREFALIAKAIADGSMLPYASDWIYIGWYHFRIGDANLARISFDEALRQLADVNNESMIADAHWGLTYVELADGHLNDAYSQLIQAADGNPTQYAELDVDSDGAKNRRYARLYPAKFLTTLGQLSDKLDEDNPAEKAVRPRKQATPVPHR